MQQSRVRNLALGTGLAVALLAASPTGAAADVWGEASLPLGAAGGPSGAAVPAAAGPGGRQGQYAGLVARHAQAAGVPVGLAQAIVRVESNYNPRARGRAGEIGLMQIKPATARGVGFAGSAQALYDPDTNLRYGMRYLAGAYQLAGGDVCGTVLRYNAGHYARRMNPVSQRYCARVRSLMGSARVADAGAERAPAAVAALGAAGGVDGLGPRHDPMRT